MFVRTTRFFTAFSAVSALAACQGSELQAPPPPTVTTTLDPATLTAGSNAAVICALVGRTRGPAPAPADFTVRYTPITGREEGLDITGRVITAKGAGTYAVHCALPSLGLDDPDGAILTVLTGTPVATRPVFSENPVTSRIPAGLLCEAFDAFGNGTVLVAPVYTADPALLFATDTNGDTVTGTVAGDFPVTCAPADGASGLEAQPETLTVLPGMPVRVELRADPARPYYGPGSVVTLFWTSYDADDNAVENPPATLTSPSTPAGIRVDPAQNRFRMPSDGRYQFVVKLDPPAPALTDSITLIVDGTPPTLTITYPPRGATIRATNTPVEVRGVATDAVGIDSVFVNGERVNLRPDNTFAHPVTSKWGLNNLTISAIDVGRNETKVTPTYQYSDRWTSFIDENARGLRQPDAAVVLLGQNFFDDGVNNQPIIDDIAGLFEMVLGNLIDLRALLDGVLAGVQIPSIPLDSFSQRIDIIPNISWVDLTFNGSIDFTVRSADSTGTGPVDVIIDSRDGGLDMEILVGDDTRPAVALDIEVGVAANFNVAVQSCSFLGCIANPPGTARIGATIVGRIAVEDISFGIATDIEKRFENPMRIEFTRLDTVIGDVQVLPIDDVNFFLTLTGVPILGDQTFELPLSSLFDVGAIFDALITPLATQLSNLLPTFVNPLIRDIGGPIIAGLFDLLVLDTTIPVPPLSPTGQEINIGFASELSTVAFTDDGGTIGLATGLHTRKNIERDPLGAIVRNDCVGASTAGLAWNWDPSFGIGLTLDLGNAALFTAWWGGLLNGPLDLGSLLGGAGGGGGIPIPLDGLVLELNWLLPPIFNDCDPNRGYVEIGDLAVTLGGNILGGRLEAEMFADFRISVAYETRPDGLYVVLGDVLETEFELIRLQDGGLSAFFDIGDLIVNVLPGLLGSFLAGQSIGPIALPPTDLSTLLPTLPAGTNLGLGNLQVRNQEGYVIIGGDLE